MLPSAPTWGGLQLLPPTLGVPALVWGGSLHTFPLPYGVPESPLCPGVPPSHWGGFPGANGCCGGPPPCRGGLHLTAPSPPVPPGLLLPVWREGHLHPGPPVRLVPGGVPEPPASWRREWGDGVGVCGGHWGSWVPATPPLWWCECGDGGVLVRHRGCHEGCHGEVTGIHKGSWVLGSHGEKGGQMLGSPGEMGGALWKWGRGESRGVLRAPGCWGPLRKWWGGNPLGGWDPKVCCWGRQGCRPAPTLPHSRMGVT